MAQSYFGIRPEYLEISPPQRNLKYNIFRCPRTPSSGQLNHDVSHPSTSSLALRARCRFRRGCTGCRSASWKRLRCSRRTLPYCCCSNSLVWWDGPGPHCFTPFTSQPRLFFPAAGSLRRARGDSCALSCHLLDTLCIVGADSVLAQCLATQGGGGAAGERTTLAKPYRSAAPVGVGRSSRWRVRLLPRTVDQLYRSQRERLTRLALDGGTASG